jgi:hypothetical protein
MNTKKETPIEGTSMKKRNTAKLSDFYVFRDGFSIKATEIGELPKDMSDPESWKKIAQVCKDNNVDIICKLDEDYNGSSIMVFKRSGNYLFFGQWLKDQAYTFATSDEVYVFSAVIFGLKLSIYYVWDCHDTGYLLFNWVDQDKEDPSERHVMVYESFGLLTNELLWDSLSSEMESF